MDYMYEDVQYPELYYRLYPKVAECVENHMGNMPMDSMPTDAEREQMIDEVYRRMITECPEITEDPDERRDVYTHNISVQQRPFYGRRRLLRDITGILILRELLRRRRPGYGYPGYGTPGYGYPGYGTPGYGYPGYGTPGYDYPGYGY